MNSMLNNVLKWASRFAVVGIVTVAAVLSRLVANALVWAAVWTLIGLFAVIVVRRPDRRRQANADVVALVRTLRRAGRTTESTTKISDLNRVAL